MNIFRAVPKAGLGSSLEEPVSCISQRRTALRLPTPWSLAELQPDEEDFRFLVTLLRHANEGVIDRWLRPQWQDRFGLVVLFLAAETARRYASEGEVWSVVAKCFTEQTRHLLFLRNNQPTQRLKDAIEVAARRHGLRHAFGTAGVQSWYQTIYLQFGFTRSGFQRRLPEWLVGQIATEAITSLRDDERLRSESFRLLWQTLRDYRRNNLTEATVRKRLSESPWVLPDWVEEVMKAARQRMELCDRPVSEAASEPDEPAFLSTPRLEWKSGTPGFVAELTNLAQLERLTEPVYALRVADQTLANLVRQQDGSYAADRDTIPLPCKPALKAALVARHTDEVAYSQVIEVWDANEDLTLFGSDGRRLGDPWCERMDGNKAYFILAADDLQLVPEMKWQRIADRWKLHELQAGWPSNLRLAFDDGDTLWTPVLGSAKAKPEPEWAAGCKLIVLEVQKAGLEVDVQVLPHVVIRFVRCGMALDVENNRCFVPLGAFGIKGTAWLQIGLQRHHEIYVVRRKVTLHEARSPLVLTLTDEGWHRLNGENIVVTAAKAGSYRFCLPRLWNNEEADWFLMEGDVCLGRPSRRPHTLRGLAGLGAELTLRPRLYNFGEKPVMVSKSVVAHGCVEDLTFDAATHTLAVQLSSSLEPSEDHKIVAWTSGQLDVLSVCACTEPQARWECLTPRDFAEPVAVAVAFRGEWLGGWFHHQADKWLPTLLETKVFEPRLVAALLRWFRLPLLSKPFRPGIQMLVARHPVAVLAAWLRNTLVELPFGLKFADRDDAWLSVVRCIFRDWQLKSDEITELFSIWMDKAETPIAAIGDAFDALLRVDPRLAVNLVRAGCPQYAKQLRFRLACAADDAAYKRNKQRLIETCSNEMQCDSRFLESLLKLSSDAQSAKVKDTRHASNLAIAIAASSDFRNLLAMYLLESLS
jgi:hypothetical protein